LRLFLEPAERSICINTIIGTDIVSIFGSILSELGVPSSTYTIVELFNSKIKALEE
jgi:hypothetical protein